MRKIFFKLHSYLALFALLPLMIVSLTGSILVFKTEIDQWLMPGVARLDDGNTFAVEPARLEFDTLQRQIESALPDYVLGAWEIYRDGKEADRVYLVKKGTDDWYKLYFDPFAGKALSPPEKLGSQFTDWLLELHYTFMLNDLTGEHSQWGTLIGLLAACILFFLGLSGLVIHRKFWRRLFFLRLNKPVRVVSGDLHRLIGVWSSPVVLVLGITGLYFNYIEYYHEVFEHADDTPHIAVSPLLNNNVSVASLLVDSTARLPEFTPTFLRFPIEPNEHLIVFGYQPSSNPFSSDYLSTASYNRHDGKLVSAVDGRHLSLGSRVFDSFRELHFGSFAGWASKLIWSLFGLAPLLLAVSGVIVWLKRHARS